jgi:mono/diheme cytochrome c family protein
MSIGCVTRSALLVAGGLLLAAKVSAQPLSPKVPLDGPGIYKAYCGACHGADGKGDGPAAEALKRKPTDLTAIAKNNKGMFPRATIEQVLQTGGKWKAHGSREMPTWGPIFLAVDANDKIAYAQIHNLVTYLESIQLK